MKKTYSTPEVAKAVGVHRITLQRWLATGKVRPSLAIPANGHTIRRFSEADVKRVKKYKEKNYYKGRGGRKPKPKQ
jgi:predicted site-specific integrase-resolvase